ncbi:MAG: HesB/IscA family protein [Sulfuricaulis sp.]
MITITPQAAKQILQSAEATDSRDMHLRIAVRREQDGTFVYGMGFDAMGEDDALLASEGVNILVSNTSKDFLIGATLDFVEISPGEHRFIFVNPNDPAHATVSSGGESGKKDA